MSHRTFFQPSSFFLLASIAAVVAFAGCGGADIGTVHGRVTVNGSPAPGGISLEFMPKTTGKPSSIAFVEPDGTYNAIYSPTGQPGVSTGPCTVRLIQDDKTMSIPKKEGQKPKPLFRAECYESLKSFEVSTGDNEVDLVLIPAS